MSKSVANDEPIGTCPDLERESVGVVGKLWNIVADQIIMKISKVDWSRNLRLVLTG